MNYLVTGAAGFIGVSLSKRLLERGDNVVDLENREGIEKLFLKTSLIVLLIWQPRQV